MKIGLDPGTRSTPEDIPVRTKVSAIGSMQSSELARLVGVSTDTLRYYERLRLLPAAPRSASGYRLFPAQALDRVRLIRGALAIGFSVRELAAILAERDRGGPPANVSARWRGKSWQPLNARSANCKSGGEN